MFSLPVVEEEEGDWHNETTSQHQSTRSSNAMVIEVCSGRVDNT
jgi:hypothetical protein